MKKWPNQPMDQNGFVHQPMVDKRFNQFQRQIQRRQKEEEE
jgi:hypothetical protein